MNRRGEIYCIVVLFTSQDGFSGVSFVCHLRFSRLLCKQNLKIFCCKNIALSCSFSREVFSYQFVCMTNWTFFLGMVGLAWVLYLNAWMQNVIRRVQLFYFIFRVMSEKIFYSSWPLDLARTLCCLLHLRLRCRHLTMIDDCRCFSFIIPMSDA